MRRLLPTALLLAAAHAALVLSLGFVLVATGTPVHGPPRTTAGQRAAVGVCRALAAPLSTDAVLRRAPDSLAMPLFAANSLVWGGVGALLVRSGVRRFSFRRARRRGCDA